MTRPSPLARSQAENAAEVVTPSADFLQRGHSTHCQSSCHFLKGGGSRLPGDKPAH